MSLQTQQIISGQTGTAAYSTADTLQALSANVALLLSFTLGSEKVLGLSVGLGVSDVAAWTSGIKFEILVNGQSKIVIEDELCTLLQKEFFPMDLPKNAKIELLGTSQHATAIQAAAFIRSERY